jgi:iron complex transport system substrate-binding protein
VKHQGTGRWPRPAALTRLLLLVGLAVLAGGGEARAAGGRERFGEGGTFAAGSPEAAGEPSAQGSAGAVEASPGFPVRLVDDAGVAVTVAKPPQRIVSLTISTDEILLGLVPAQRIAAVTLFSRDPDVSNVAEEARRVPQALQLNVEMVLSLRPDLVFVASWNEASDVAQLRASGVPVYLLATGVTVAEIEEKIRTVARLVGEEERGREMVRRMESRLADLAARLERIPPEARLTAMDYTTWGSSQGAGSSWDEIVRRAGLLNAVARLSADKWGQVALSRETLLRLDPDILILPGWVYGKPAGARSFFESIVNDPALQSMSAVREGRVYRMPEALRAAASQYVADAVEYLARLAYPQLWKD